MPLKLDEIRKTGLVGDGWIGGELLARGLSAALPPDAANVNLPAAVEDAITAFAEAGARLLCTNTIHANRPALARWGWAECAADVNRAGTEIARRVADAVRPVASVAGQIGPSGKLLSIGEASAGELQRAFAEQATALEQAGADVILLARFSDVAELLVAMRGVRQATCLPLLATLIFDSGVDRLATAEGVSAAQAAATLTQEGADAIGADCAPPETALSLVQELASNGGRPVMIRVNAGSPELGDAGAMIFPEEPAAFARRVAGLRAAGAAIIAGCCGVRPVHTRELCAALGGARPPGGPRGRR